MKSLIPITQVPALIEAWYGWRPHEMTVYRWMQGVHGGAHKLQTIKRGSRRLTSHGALRRFMREWSGDPAVTLKVPTTKQSRTTSTEHGRAIEALKKMGMKL